MSRNINDLMRHTPDIPKIDTAKQKEIDTLIIMSDAIANLTNQSIYVVDYLRQELLYVSPHPLLLCGYTKEEVKEMGFSFMEKILSPNDLQLFLETRLITWQIAYNVPVEDRSQFRASYDIHFRHTNGDEVLINKKVAPLLFTEDGYPWIGVSFVSPSPRKEVGYYAAMLKTKNLYFRYNTEKKIFESYESEKLTKREEEIMRLSMQGYTEKAIAEKMSISIRTVRNHRCNTERKLGVNNMANAVAMFGSVI
ncbi:MAG: helix-turn-helix transcriptional regulator [Prevotellaceae bacterium]|jgi:DNA-binding CsgD family transcriptional regulator|nr:helix-turn-helix transcriptional regulator [Prevotellaceae bacterium]